MAKNSLIYSNYDDLEIDIFGDKSSLVLFTLFQNGSSEISVNQIAKTANVSVGLAHKVIKHLVYVGFVKSTGLRTNKKFYCAEAGSLLIGWIDQYSILKKTKRKAFEFADPNIAQLDNLNLVPAVHTAAKILFHSKATNLNSKEYYLSEWSKLPKIVEKLNLVEMDRGYQLLLIKPYYKSLVSLMNNNNVSESTLNSYELLTFLDLIHYPIRGLEQAEVLFKKSSFLKSISSWSKIENAIG